MELGYSVLFVAVLRNTWPVVLLTGFVFPVVAHEAINEQSGEGSVSVVHTCTKWVVK